VHIDWTALLVVALVSIATSVVFSALLAAGIRFVVSGRDASRPDGASTVTVSLGYTLLALAGLLVLFGIYLIVPQLH